MWVLEYSFFQLHTLLTLFALQYCIGWIIEGRFCQTDTYTWSFKATGMVGWMCSMMSEL